VAVLGEEERQEVDLEEQVAELVEQLLRAAARGRVRDLVRLLDGVRDDRARGLLPVPRAVAAEPLGERLKREKGLGETLLVGSGCPCGYRLSEPVSDSAVVGGGWKPTW
jgi:hypothetical protein